LRWAIFAHRETTFKFQQLLGHFQILSDAVALFGDRGPSTNNDRRHQQLASFTSAHDSELDALDSKYYKCNENVDVLLSTYALKNKEHFTRGK